MLARLLLLPFAFALAGDAPARDYRPLDRAILLADVGPPTRRRRRRRRVQLPAKRHPKITQKWKVKIGRTHFRHTIVALGDRVIVGTNGTSLNGVNETDDGVYVVHGRTGRIARVIRHSGRGDRDVNGVSTDGQHVYFGTDENGVYKHSLMTGRRVWRVSVDGDVEGAPALARLNRDAVLDVVVGTESGSVYAIDGRRGRVLWRKRTGALPMYGARGVMASPAVGRINRDRVPDVVVGSRDGKMRAYNGRNGRLLWSYRTSSGIHASATLRDLNGDGRLDVLGATSYSRLFALDGRTGRALWTRELQQPSGGIEGLFSTPVVLERSRRAWCALIGTAWWGHREAMYCARGQRVHWRFNVKRGKISSSVAIADLLPGGGAEVAFGGEDGNLYLLDSNGVLLARMPTGGAIECTPAIADVDGDGKLELLAASGDGYLYAFDTPSRGPVAVSGFRHDARATGQQTSRLPVTFWLRAYK